MTIVHALPRERFVDVGRKRVAGSACRDEEGPMRATLCGSMAPRVETAPRKIGDHRHACVRRVRNLARRSIASWPTETRPTRPAGAARRGT